MIELKKKSKKKVNRFLENWRDLLKAAKQESDKLYAEAMFEGAWMVFSDKEAVYLLTNLTKDEFDTIIEYPIWM